MAQPPEAQVSERLLLLHGADDFSRHELVHRLIADLGEEAAFNLTKLDGEKLTVDEFQSATMTPPFLGSRRLIIVEGLLARFQRSERGRRDASPDLGPWGGLADVLPTLPPTTTVIFNESVVASNNPLWRLLRPVVTAREFRPTRTRPAAVGARAGPPSWCTNQGRGTHAHCDSRRRPVGSPGRAGKLALYAEGHPITDEMVRLLASGAREANVFDLVNTISPTADPRRFASCIISSSRNGALTPSIPHGAAVPHLLRALDL
jgi:hypothetical protein